MLIFINLIQNQLKNFNYENMEKIDLKDRKILYELDLDSRQSLRAIGRKVGLSKDVVTSRIKKLQDKGVIKKFYTFINYLPFGYTAMRFYFNFQYASTQKKKEIIDHFIKNDYVLFAHQLDGNFDLGIIMATKNLNKFFDYWEKTLDKYRDYFANQIFSLYIRDLIYRYSFLLADTTEKIDRKYSEFVSTDRIDIDNLDQQILKLIAPNSRIPTIEIAKKLHTTTTTINKRINNLIKIGVIHCFRIHIDFSKLGYRWYKIDIHMKDRSQTPRIINYIKYNPYNVNIVKTLGYCDLELGFILKNVDEVHKIMEDINNKFPNTLRNYTYFCLEKSLKWTFLPKQ